METSAGGSSSARQIHHLREAIFASPFELIVNFSDARLRIWGMLIFFGEPIYWFFWAVLLPQPYESLALRVAAMASAVPQIFPDWLRRLPRGWMGAYIIAAWFFALPFSFAWLYAANGFSWLWLASCVAMIYILFQGTDWRIAILQVLAGMPLGIAAGIYAGGITLASLPHDGSLYVHSLVLVFAVITALLLAASGANMRLERLKASLTTLAIMAHEFRTPFAAAGILSSKILVEAQKLPPGQSRDEIIRAARQLVSSQSSVNGMINYQLLNARYLEPLPDASAIDASIELERAVLEFPFHATSERDHVRVDIEPGLHINGHPETFRHVVYNLLSNSQRAISRVKPRMGAGDIEVSLFREEDHAVLTIADRGCGIPAPKLARLFDPYQSTQTELAHGLGLAMVKRTVDKMGGDIHCDSTENEGTTFRIVLPLSSYKSRGIFGRRPRRIATRTK